MEHVSVVYYNINSSYLTKLPLSVDATHHLDDLYRYLGPF